MKYDTVIAFLRSGPFRINPPQKEGIEASLSPSPSAQAAKAIGGGGRRSDTGITLETEQAFDHLAKQLEAARQAEASEGVLPKSAVSAPLPAAPPGDPYLTRLVKLIPSEVLALYLSFKEVAASWLGIWAMICLVLVFIVRTVGTRQAGKQVQWGAVVIALVSFILWIYATGGYFLQIHLPASVPGIVSVAIGLWTFVLSYVYRGE